MIFNLRKSGISSYILRLDWNLMKVGRVKRTRNFRQLKVLIIWYVFWCSIVNRPVVKVWRLQASLSHKFWRNQKKAFKRLFESSKWNFLDEFQFSKDWKEKYQLETFLPTKIIERHLFAKSNQKLIFRVDESSYLNEGSHT